MWFLLEVFDYQQLAIHLVRSAQEHTGYVGSKIGERGLYASGSTEPTFYIAKALEALW